MKISTFGIRQRALRFRLPAQRATLKLLDKHTGKLIAEYAY